MLKSTTWFGLRGIKILTAVVCCSSISFAFSSLPVRTDRWISDLAGVVTTTDETAIRAVLQHTKATTGDEITVVSIASQTALSKNTENWELFATRWFNTWQIGNTSTNRGVLLLVAVQDRRVRIELGKGFSRAYDAVMKCVIATSMIPRFKQDDYSRGIVNGVNAIIRAIRSKSAPCPGVSFAPVALPKPNSSVSPRPQQIQNPSRPVLRDLKPVRSVRPEAFSLPLGGLLGGGGLLILAWFGRNSFSKKPKKCKQCGSDLQKLDEQSDNEYLEDGQRLEEILKSVNYDVWMCNSCHQRSVVRHEAWFSSYSDCPSCARKTLRSDRQVLIQPSYTFTGQDRVLRNCKHCNFQDSHVIVTKRLERTQSSGVAHGIAASSIQQRQQEPQRMNDSGSDNSSGGSSSGGGASGSW